MVGVGGEEGAYIIFCVFSSHIYGFLHLDATTSEPVEALQPSRFKPPVTLPSHYSTKTLEGPQTLSEYPLVKGKCTMLCSCDSFVGTINLSVDILVSSDPRIQADCLGSYVWVHQVKMGA